jgi:hypothetical protein
LSRGFHRLGLFLAAIPLLVGATIVLSDAKGKADRKHQMVLCAHKFIEQTDERLAQYRERLSQSAKKTTDWDAYFSTPGEIGAPQQPTPHLDELLRQPPIGHADAPQPPAGHAPATKRLLTDEEILRPDAPPPAGEVRPFSDEARLEFRLLFAPDDAELSLKQCSIWEDDPVTLGEARNPPAFHWLRLFAAQAWIGLAFTLLITFSLYGLVRAIGWVVSGFTA